MPMYLLEIKTPSNTIKGWFLSGFKELSPLSTILEEETADPLLVIIDKPATWPDNSWAISPSLDWFIDSALNVWAEYDIFSFNFTIQK